MGRLCLARPYFSSPSGARHLWEALGVNVRRLDAAGQEAAARWQVLPQPASRYRALRDGDEAALLDMAGGRVPAARNPGVRMEPDFISEAEELSLVREMEAAACDFGYGYACEEEDDDDELDGGLLGLEEDEEEEDDEEEVLRMSGRGEGQPEELLAPWGYGSSFDYGRLPPTLAEVVERIAGLPGYRLGPLRDVTVNLRRSVDYQMAPHIDPPTDGPNTFVLSLQSEAVITFSPVQALEVDAMRANDAASYSVQSYTDDDLDCLVGRRSLYHMSGDARYLWTHGIRPPLIRDVTEEGFEAYDRWGTWDNGRRRCQRRIAIVLAFADPWAGEPSAA